MTTITERISKDLPLAAIPVANEVALASGGRVGIEGADLKTQRNADQPRDPNTAVNEDQHELLTDVNEVWTQIAVSGGIVPATLLNMHPWKITATGPHNTGIIIPACPIQDEFIPFVQRTMRMDFGDRWGKFKVRPSWPIEIMNDFKRQHYSWQGGESPAGGIVVYMGDHLPGQASNRIATANEKLQRIIQRVTDSELRSQLEAAIDAERKTNINPQLEKRLSDKQIISMIHEAKQQQVMFYEKVFDWAEQRAAEKNKTAWGSVTSMHRQVALWMLHRGRISKLPSWVSERKPLDHVQKHCPRCGSELNDKGYSCAKCNRVDKPYLAFKDGAIGPDDPALKRCTREELDNLGLVNVKTLDEEIEGSADVSNDSGEAKEAKGAKKDKDKKAKD